jgi:N-methylhydantoinase A
VLLGVDVGGTFTDAALVCDDGATHTAKVPSTPAEQSAGVLEAIREVLASAGASAGQVQRFAHGMTVATNALLEGRGARTAIVATEGFTDLVELGRQARPHLYRLCVAGPAALAPPELRFAVDERMTPEGPLRSLEEDSAQALLERLVEGRPEAVAVVLLHSYAHPEHERDVGDLISTRLPGTHVSLSHELVGTFREYERAVTTEADAALSPLVGDYVRRLSRAAAQMGLPEPQIMQSSGGLTSPERASAHAALTVLSGPAGGVTGALLVAERADAKDVLCFDMGGTSCDVCLIEDLRVAETAERVVAGRPLALPMLDIHTVGAGGGSIAWRDSGGALRVGPQSAGALPGPACYGQDGKSPTVTDANLLLGRLPDDGSLGGRLTLDRDAAERAVADLAGELEMGTIPCAEGIVRVAEAEMLRALRVMSIERGLDPRGFALMPFGGAGPLHAAALARELGIRRILCPRASGVLCALGLAAGTPRRDVARTVMLTASALCDERVNEERDALIGRALAELDGKAAEIGVRYELRYRGQSFELPVREHAPTDPSSRFSPDPDRGTPTARQVDAAALREAFAQVHEERYGYRGAYEEIELVTIRVSAWSAAPGSRGTTSQDSPPARSTAKAPSTATSPTRASIQTRRVIFEGRELDAAWLSGELPSGTQVRGPAVCALPDSTLLVPPGWEGEVDTQGTVRLVDRHHHHHHASPGQCASPGTQP